MGIRRIGWLFALLAIPTLTCHALDLNKTVTKAGTEMWGVDELGGLKWALVVEYEDMNLNFTNNSYNKYGYDTNWTLVEVLDFNTKLVVEYEDIPQQNLNFTENSDGKYDDGIWTLDKVPDFDTRLVVEYEDINLNFTEEATGNWTLSEAPDFNTKLVVEYEDENGVEEATMTPSGDRVLGTFTIDGKKLNDASVLKGVVFVKNGKKMLLR
ncbi:MAG: hypothetical protein IJJ78_07140 [Paludibacteraceae bacterium]|nr:hypothetical protein [Paludibacteraceae bacterium]